LIAHSLSPSVFWPRPPWPCGKRARSHGRPLREQGDKRKAEGFLQESGLGSLRETAVASACPQRLRVGLVEEVRKPKKMIKLTNVASMQVAVRRMNGESAAAKWFAVFSKKMWETRTYSAKRAS
jgi:hypothetical protein